MSARNIGTGPPAVNRFEAAISHGEIEGNADALFRRRIRADAVAQPAREQYHRALDRRHLGGEHVISVWGGCSITSNIGEWNMIPDQPCGAFT